MFTFSSLNQIFNVVILTFLFYREPIDSTPYNEEPSFVDISSYFLISLSLFFFSSRSVIFSSMYNENRTIFIFFSLTFYLEQYILGPFILSQMARFDFLWLSNIPVCVSQIYIHMHVYHKYIYRAHVLYPFIY